MTSHTFWIICFLFFYFFYFLFWSNKCNLLWVKTWQKLQALNGIVYLLYLCNSTHFFYQVAWFDVLFMSKVQRDLFKSITQNLSNSNSDALLGRHHLVSGFGIFFKGKVKYFMSNTQPLWHQFPFKVKHP